MIGSSISGVTFVSVPGWVQASQFSYLQMALGFVAGQLVIAFVLIPLFYRMGLVSNLPVSGEPFRHRVVPDRGLVLLSVENDRGCREGLSGLPRDAVAGIRAAACALRVERGGDDDPRVALHVPGRRQVADLDRLAEDVLSGSQRRPLHLFYRFGPASGFRRCGRRRSAARLFADFLFRRSERPAVFLQAVSGRSLHRDRDDRARPGHDAAQPELPQLPRFAEEHRDQRRVAAVRHPALSRSRRAALPLCREERHPDAGSAATNCSR